MELISGLLTGISMAAASGFRIFVPYLFMSIAVRSGWISLGESNVWLGSNIALFGFGFLVLLEILGYYNPWMDNMLDLISTPFALISGTIIMMIVMESKIILNFFMSLIIGGGTALGVQFLCVKARSISNIFRSGTGNTIISTLELLFSVSLSIFSFWYNYISIAILISIFILFFKLTKIPKEKTVN